jgi:hypothetical protein
MTSGYLPQGAGFVLQIDPAVLRRDAAVHAG